ncbi:hypothetical protein F4779DRAFT_608392 [Xylariaceae sp. FL0662B]|nr:hypothetical protein F4779DRAFT_608392 [Xylariaceae sp. FL0662B]
MPCPDLRAPGWVVSWNLSPLETQVLSTFRGPSSNNTSPHQIQVNTMTIQQQTPTPPPEVCVTDHLLDDLDASVRETQRKFMDLVYNIASLRAQYEDLQRRFAANPTKEEHEALVREKEAWERKAKELQTLVDDARGVVSGDLKRHTEVEFRDLLASRDAAIRERDAAMRERDAALRGSDVRDVTLRDDYGNVILEVHVTD